MHRTEHSKKNPSTEDVYSPLHRLQADLARDKEFPFTLARQNPQAPATTQQQQQLHPGQVHPGQVHPEQLQPEQVHPEQSLRRNIDCFDNESIYSFDSVSTSGRLLDRLDLDADDYIDPETSIRHRESVLLMLSMGRPWDPALDDHKHGLNSDLTQIAIRGNSSLGLDRMRSLNKLGPTRSLSQSNRLPIHAVPAAGLALQKKNTSFDSLHADITSRQSSSTSISSAADSATASRPSLLSRQGNLRLSQKLPQQSPIPEAVLEMSSPSLSHTATFASPLPKNNPPNGHPQNGHPQNGPGQSHNTHKRSARSVSSSSLESAAAAEITTGFILHALSKFDPAIDAATRQALNIRAEGNHREASYQLQILANAPHNYPKAMYLYAKALRVGQGVKLNEAQSVRWLCRCVLTSYIAETSAPTAPAFTTYVSKLANLLPEVLLEMVKINLAGEKHEPVALMERFQSLSASAVHKVCQLNNNDRNVVGGAYYLLGDAVLKGQGVALKDEATGRLLLAKSASYAYANSMSELGELWCTKTKHFKKDYHVAAAWLRMAELFGKQDLGNSWIYKSKYMEHKKK